MRSNPDECDQILQNAIAPARRFKDMITAPRVVFSVRSTSDPSDPRDPVDVIGGLPARLLVTRPRTSRHLQPVTEAVARQSEAVEAVDVVHAGRWPGRPVLPPSGAAGACSTAPPPFVAPSWGRIGRSPPTRDAAGVHRHQHAQDWAALWCLFRPVMAVAMAMYSVGSREGDLCCSSSPDGGPVLCWILFAVLWFKFREVRQCSSPWCLRAIFAIDAGRHAGGQRTSATWCALSPTARQFF
jgi:hypothetical protein